MPVQIAPVRGFADLREFVALPFRLHAGTPWIPSLKLERYAFLNRRLNAYFRHGEAEYFLARRGGRVVGRVTASEEALKQMRYELGETQIAKSRPGSLRERYGIYGGLNCLHLSDAPETGAAEVKRWSGLVQLDQVKVRLDDVSDKPDHTFHLRSLATQVAGGIHTELASQMIRELLAQESDLGGEKLDALCRITLGALS